MHPVTAESILIGMLGRHAWMEDKACTGRTDDMVLFLNSKPSKEGRAKLAKALAICATCPVQAECADWAIHLPTGLRITGAVVGGLTPGQLNAARNTAEAKAERKRRYRYRCGTLAAYKIHRERGEICTTCLNYNTGRQDRHRAA